MKAHSPGLFTVKEKNSKPCDVIESPDSFNNSNEHYSNALKIFFIILQFLLSFDYGFLEISKKSVVAKILSITSAGMGLTTFVVYSMIYDPNSFNGFLVTVLVQYLFVVIRLFFNKSSNTFCMFLKRMSSIDYAMSGSLKHVNCKVIRLFSGILIYKTLVSIVHCKYVPYDCMHGVVPSYVVYFISPCLDLHLLLYAVSFHMVLSRLKKIRTVIRDSNDVTIGHVVYKSLVESLEKCKTCFDVLYLCTLVFKIPDALFTSFSIIQDVKFQGLETYATVLVYLNIVFQYLVILIVPAVEASLLAREVDRIKIILHDKLLLERGAPSETVAIKMFLQYIEARPMRFHILTLIPLNSSLPFLILNVYATYLIVTLQLSHLY